ncbi:hypothetical protein BH11MYX1_BH11MYX1_09510 [soil metagenome]
MVLLFGCHAPIVTSHAPDDLALDYVGTRSLHDRARGAVYALTDDAVVAIDPASGKPRWSVPAKGDELTGAGPFLAVIGTKSWNEKALSLVRPDGQLAATCLLTIPAPEAANTVEVTPFGVDGIVYVFYLTWRFSEGGGHAPELDTVRREEAVARRARSCGLVRLDLGNGCRAVVEDLERFNLQRCEDSTNPADYLAPLAKVRPTSSATPLPVEERTVHGADPLDQVVQLVGRRGAVVTWQLELNHYREPAQIP